jgi:outer membrane lipoprotein-sorting protein
MHRFFYSLLFILSFSLSASAQKMNAATLSQLRKVEDSMKVYGEQMISGQTAAQRFVADSVFIKMLVRALKTPNSFNYPFDSLQTVSHIYAPDSSFRIFSWQFTRDNDYHRQRGAIQMKTADGSLKLFPLVDMSDFTTAPQDSIRIGANWIGAIYYGIIQKTFNGKNFYTLLGFDDNNMRSTKKWIEVLSFDDKGRPVFGGPFFSIPSDDIKTSGSRQARFAIEYKKDGKARMNYDKDLDMIVYDHLISETNEQGKPYTMVPDGDYQGFKWANGKWVLVDKVFDFKLEDGQAPMPAPLKDADGRSDELKLMQQSEKNRQSQKQPLPAQPKAPVKKTKDPKQAKDDDSY